MIHWFPFFLRAQHDSVQLSRQVTSRERNPQFCGSPNRFRDRGFYSIQANELVCPETDIDLTRPIGVVDSLVPKTTVTSPAPTTTLTTELSTSSGTTSVTANQTQTSVAAPPTTRATSTTSSSTLQIVTSTASTTSQATVSSHSPSHWCHSVALLSG